MFDYFYELSNVYENIKNNLKLIQSSVSALKLLPVEFVVEVFLLYLLY
jgi:hypothetical protein